MCWSERIYYPACEHWVRRFTECSIVSDRFDGIAFRFPYHDCEDGSWKQGTRGEGLCDRCEKEMIAPKPAGLALESADPGLNSNPWGTGEGSSQASVISRSTRRYELNGEDEKLIEGEITNPWYKKMMTRMSALIPEPPLGVPKGEAVPQREMQPTKAPVPSAKVETELDSLIDLAQLQNLSVYRAQVEIEKASEEAKRCKYGTHAILVSGRDNIEARLCCFHNTRGKDNGDCPKPPENWNTGTGQFKEISGNQFTFEDKKNGPPRKR